MVCLCLVRTTKPKKLFAVLLGVAFSTLFIRWFITTSSESYGSLVDGVFLLYHPSYIATCADVHSDVPMSVKCSGGIGCSRYNGTLAQVVSEALEATEGSSVRLQGVYTVMYIYIYIYE